jgi:hypothetical protein
MNPNKALELLVDLRNQVCDIELDIREVGNVASSSVFGAADDAIMCAQRLRSLLLTLSSAVERECVQGNKGSLP